MFGKLMGYPPYFEDAASVVFHWFARVLRLDAGSRLETRGNEQSHVKVLRLCYAVPTWIATFTLRIAHLAPAHGILTH